MIKNLKYLFTVGLFLCFTSSYNFLSDDINNSKNETLGSFENNRYVFQNYAVANNELTNINGRGVAFDNNGDVGYVSNAGGIDIGIKNNLLYHFTNYNSSTDGITDNTGTDIAFDNNGNIGYAAFGGGLSIGIKDGSSYNFTNYTSSIAGITNNDGLGVAFDSEGDIAYATDGGGLSIGIKHDSSYEFTNYNSTVNGINNNSGSGVAFDSNGDVGYVAFGGGLSIGIKHGSSYTFTNYNTSTSGITNNNGYGVAFDSEGNVGYASYGGLSIGIKHNSSYTFTNYNSATDGITSDNGLGVAFDSNGNIGYASYDGGLSIGTKNGTNYDFRNYHSSNFSITSENVYAVSFANNGDVGIATDGGLSIGSQTISAYIDVNNTVYEKNETTSTNYSIEDFTISFSNKLYSIVNNLNSTFIQITVSDSTNKYYIGYLTKDRITPNVTNRAPDYNSYLQKQTIQQSNTYDFVAEKITNGTSGFANSTSLNVSVKYGSSQNNLTEALPTNDRTITLPNVNPTVLSHTYKPQSFVTNDQDYIFDNKKHTYNISNISLAFDDNLKTLLLASPNPVTNFIEIDVYDGQNIDNSYISTIIYIVNTTDNKDEAISDANKLNVDDNTYEDVININSISGDVTSFDNLSFHNLLASTNYNVAITYGSNQTNREDMIGSDSDSTLSFVTPQAPATIPNNPTPPPSNGSKPSNVGAIAGGVVGGVVGISLVSVGGFYFYKKSFSKKR